MTTKIFTSQSSMDAGRNRPHRRLEAALDREQLQKHICKHNEYCTIRRTLDKAHCSRDYAKTCQTAKFYLKYGEAGNSLGVGS